MKAVSFNLIERVEDSTSFLTCAVDALWLLQEELSVNLNLRQQSGDEVGYFQRLSSAMVPALREMDRLKDDLDAVITAAYEQKKEGEI